MQLPEIESPVQNISTYPSLEPRVPRIAIVGAGFRPRAYTGTVSMKKKKKKKKKPLHRSPIGV